MDLALSVAASSLLVASLAPASPQGGGCEPAWLPTFGATAATNGPVEALAVFDDGSGPALYAGGSFTVAGGVAANNVAKWDGASWSPLGSGTDGAVLALTVCDLGDGPALYAGGHRLFLHAGGVPVNRVAKWDGTSWSPLGHGIGGFRGDVYVLREVDLGRGPALVAGGTFSWAGWGEAWCIAVWNGVDWAPFGSGLSGSYDLGVHALESFDDGSGHALYVGGVFLRAGGLLASSIARFDGTSWSTLGGMHGDVFALRAFDDGSGPALYAAGDFDAAGGVPASRIARWDGTSWTPLGAGLGPAQQRLVRTLAVFDDGSGPALHAGGSFTSAGGAPAGGIARWDGSAWSPLGGGVSDGLYTEVLSLVPFDGAGGVAALYAGGSFASALDSGDGGLARWQGCLDTAAPAILHPSRVVALDRFPGPAGEVVTFAVSATDNVDPAPSVVCAPPSGSTFPPGTTVVTCIATDAVGNQSVRTFPVLVAPAWVERGR